MRHAKWLHKIYGVFGRTGVGRRVLAGLLAVVTTLGLVDFALPSADAAPESSYEAEKTKRLEEYNKKFDLSKLLWSGKTEANGNIDYGGSARNYLYWAPGQFGGVNYKNYIHVFAFEGDTICFGSDVANSQLNAEGTANANGAQKEEIKKRLGDGATVDIVMTDLRGNRILYDVVEGGKGHIPDVQTEVLAKTMESPEGNSADKLEATFSGVDVGEGLTQTYTPLTYKVQETGVYTFEFHSYAYTGNVGVSRYGQTTKNDEVTSAGNIQHNFYRPEGDHSETSDDDHCALVAAWDISVFNEQGHKETGRVYADYLSLQQSGSYNVVESYYVVTTDSYIYRWDWLGNRPNTYNFFADNKGLTDNATGSTLYKSVKELTNANFDYTRFGVSFKYPGSANTDESKSYYIFFEEPNPDLEGHLYTKAIQPDPAENIRFVDTIVDPKSQEEVAGSYVGMGGYFAFDTKEATTATLVLKFDQIEVGKEPAGTYAPVTISGPVKPYSTNYFYWDGRDGNGEVIPVGEYKIEDIVELTTKAGEIHFPVHDMEYAPGGFTFTRVSPIYDREGNRVDTPDSILDATKSVIYYDDSAIYYGEKVGSTGLTEEGVRPEGTSETRTLRDLHADTHVIDDGNGGTYYRYNNMANNGGEYAVRNACAEYVGGVTKKNDNVDAENFIRIGDHSHTTNTIQYYTDTGTFLTDSDQEYTDQQAKINYLDSAAHPVAKVPTWTTSVSGTNVNYGDTTDYGIADFWTFIPAMPAKVADTAETIQIIDGTAFNLTGQVFYDKNSNGTYDSMKDSDTLLSGVTLNLYKKTSDKSPAEGKTYVTLGAGSTKVNNKDTVATEWKVVNPYTGSTPEENNAYELYRTDVTPVSGRYFFTNIPYKEGDTFIYEVVRPNSSYYLTSGQKTPTPHTTGGTQNGSYALYAYDTAAHGTEVQVITVGGDGGVDPNVNEMDDPNHTITAVDVGYHYELNTKLTLKKTWAVKTATDAPEPAVFEVCYVDNRNESHVYREEPLSEIQNLEYSYELLPSEMDGAEVKDWYVAAEYYIDTLPDNKTYLFKHSFNYDTTSGTYTSFVGESQYIELTNTNSDSVIDQRDLEDTNKDGVSNWDDLAGLTGWTDAGGSVTAPFHAVLDRNPGTAEITISITNSDDPGVIEILKYTGSIEDRNYLQGATFRLYDSTSIEKIQGMIDGGELAKLEKLQVGSNSTRANGKVAFAGLDPTKHYVLRETFAPTGYRIMDELYLIHPANCPDYESGMAGLPEEDAEQYRRQNFCFGEDGTADYVQAAIANIPANGDMAIRKQIDGRAWNDNDSFSFDIAFRNSERLSDLITVPDPITTGEDGSVNLNGAIVIDKDEYDIVTGNGVNVDTFRGTLTEFINAFNKPDKSDVTVNSKSDPAKNVITLVDGQKIEELLPDTNQSVPLIVNSEVTYDADGNPTNVDLLEDAQLNTTKTNPGADTNVYAADPHKFPAAGTYTFTVSENDLDGGTLNKSLRVFTVVVKVTRELDPGEPVGTPPNTGNSYLVASVDNIYYQDPTDEFVKGNTYPTNYGARRIYAGVAPTFTNTYYVQPAIQTTSYAITKNFTGRLDTNGQPINSGDGNEYTTGWRADDHFYVSITGADPETQAALEAGNIYIGGLHGKRNSDGTFAEQKWVAFNQTNVTNANDTTDEAITGQVDPGHTFTFEEIDFQKLEFPVKWVFSDATKLPEGKSKGDLVPEAEGEKNVVVYKDADTITGLPEGNYFVVNPTSENPAEYYPVESRTEDIVYNLEIREHQPKSGEAAYLSGVKYDDKVYTLVITLKNAPGGEAGNTVDGIVDELDFKLYACDSNHIAENEPQATCETDQKVVTTFKDWAEAKFDESEIDGGWTKKWYYVNNSGDDPVIREAEVVEWSDGTESEKVPTKFKVMVPRTGGGSGEQAIFIVPDDSGEANSETYTYTFETLQEAASTTLTFIAKREGHTNLGGTSGHTMTFSNTYEATGTWTPTITKTLNGRDWQEGETFDFSLECTEYPGTYNPLATSQTINIGKPGSGGNQNSGNFDAVTFNAPGVYKFTIKETHPGAGLGGGDHTPDITLKITAQDQNDGKLFLTVEAEGATTPPADSDLGTTSNNVTSTIHFVNTYSDSGAFVLAVAKTLTGKNWGSDEKFDFTIEAKKQSGGNWVDIQDGDPLELPGDSDSFSVVAGDPADETGQTRTHTLGTVKVGNLRGNPATYRFTIAENMEGFDSRHLYCAQPTIYLTVTVTPNKADGTDKVVATYAYLETAESHELTGDPLTLPFTNRYYADTEVPDTGFKVAKSFTGRPGDEWRAGDTFNVTVAFDSNSTGKLADVFVKAPGSESYEKTDGETYSATLTFSNGNTDKKSFDFRFFEVGKYVFTVNEESGGIAGVTYDTSTYTVTFDVTRSTEGDHELVVTRTITKNGAAVDGGTVTFANTYTATGRWTPTVKKTLNGRAWQTGEAFTFKLECTSWPESPNDTYKPVIADEKSQITVNHVQSTDGVSFDTVTLNRAGNYTFKISEVGKGSGLGTGGVTPESGEIVLNVNAADNGNGTLNITVIGDGGTSSAGGDINATSTVTFVNTYNERGSFDFDIQKTLTGRDWNAGDKFTFRITPDDVANDAISAGTVTVPNTWKDDDKDGTYTVTVGESAQAGAEGTKTLKLGTLEVGNLSGQPAKYVFDIEEDTTGFDALNLYCAQPKIRLTVNVDPNLSTGTHSFTAVYAYLNEAGSTTPSEGNPTALPFVNRYFVSTEAPGAGEASHGFTVAKTLTGRPGNGWQSGDEFTVTVAFSGGEGNPDGTHLQEQFRVKSGESYVEWVGAHSVKFTDADRSETFDFRFYEEGMYAFTVRETAGAIPGVTYDATTYTVTFHVTKDAENGNRLVVARTITGGDGGTDGGTITFNNTYTATGRWTPKVTKTLNGRAWQTDEAFKFALDCTSWPGSSNDTYKPVIAGEKSEITVNETASTDGVPFGTVTLNREGEYHFTVTETDTEGHAGVASAPVGGIEITVNATDNNNGTLNLTVAGDGGTAPEGGSDVTSTVNFVNTYSESGEFAVSVSKLLTGRAWKTNETFDFTVEPGDDATRAAIQSGPLSVPWDTYKDGNAHTVTVGAGGDTAATEGSWTKKTHSLGNLKVGHLGGDGDVTYKFRVSEDTSGFGGDIYCRQPTIDLSVNVKSDPTTAKHTFSATYAYLGESETHGGDAAGITLPFTNAAAAQDVGTGEVGSVLTIGKTIVGRGWLSDSYTVALSLTDGDAENVRYNDNGSTEYHELPTQLSHGFTSSDGTEPDPWELNLRFYAEGMYVFTVTEQPPASVMHGVVCDDSTYIVTYAVTSVSGTLQVYRSVSRDGEEYTEDNIAFVNVYTPAPAIWTPSVSKILNGRDWVPADSFTFVLTQVGDTSVLSDPMSVTIGDASNHTAAFGNITFTEAGNYEFAVWETDPTHGIKPGITPEHAYTIKVTAADNTSAGRLELSFERVHPEPVLDAGGLHYDTETTFTNTYSQQPGTFALELQKTLSGREWQTGDAFTFIITPGGEIGPDDMTFPEDWAAESDGSYTFTVSGSGTPAAGDTRVLSLGSIGVNTPGTYHFTVTETAGGEDTYCPEDSIILIVKASAETDDSGEPTGNMVVTTFAYTGSGENVGHDAADGTTTLPFTNYAYAGVDLTLEKTFTDSTSGSAKAWTDGFFLAEVTLESGPDGQMTCGGTPLAVGRALTVPLTNDGKKLTFRFMSEGEYVFAAREVRGGVPGITYDESTYTVTVNVTADAGGVLTAVAETTKNGAAADGIVFENSYRESAITGGLTVIKTVAGGGTPGETFGFTVTLSGADVNGVFGGMEFINNVAEFRLEHDGAISAVGLPAGITYTVAEEPSGEYIPTAVGERGRIPANGSVTAAFVNTPGEVSPPHQDGTGSLSIVKNVGGAAGETDREWHFTVQLTGSGAEEVSGVYGEMTFAGGSAEAVLKSGHSVTAAGLPAGLRYTVTEAEAGLDGYETSASGETGYIVDGGTAAATFINYRDKAPEPTGSLTVAKVVSGSAGETGREWHFTVALTGDGAAEVTGSYGGAAFTGGTASIVLKHGERKTMTGIPAGLGYTVTETEADTDGYTTTSVGAEGTIEANREAAAVFTNVNNGAPAEHHGFLTVTKTVTGNGGELDREFSFTVTLSDTNFSEESFENGTAVFALKDGGSATFELPEGTEYTVVEDSNPGYTQSAYGWMGKIAAGETSVAAFVNDRQLSVGSLTVAKTVSGSAGDREKEWNFHVTLGDSLVDGEYGGVTFTAGEADFTLKHGESVTFDGLPAGTAYTVTEEEANQGSYITTASNDTGHIPANSAVFVEFVNELYIAPPPSDRSGDLVVTKTVAGDGADTGREWRFRVTLGDTGLTGRYGDMFFTDGTAEFTLKHGESASALKLPAGTSYAVTELDADSDGYTTSASGTFGTITDGGISYAAFVNSRDAEPTAEPSADVTPEPTQEPTPGPSSDATSEPTAPPSADVTPGSTPEDTPKTGDDSRAGLWAMLMTVSIAGAAAVSFSLWKKRRVAGSGEQQQ